ncbi:MAG: hypothetical protein ACM3WU_09845 [Bacillota bacterium]
MRYRKDKDLGWIITFVSFLVFLLSAIISAAAGASPADVPEAVILANAHLSTAFVAVVSSFVRYAALGGLIYGVVGIITWPPGNG